MVPCIQPVPWLVGLWSRRVPVLARAADADADAEQLLIEAPRVLLAAPALLPRLATLLSSAIFVFAGNPVEIRLLSSQKPGQAECRLTP